MPPEMREQDIGLEPTMKEFRQPPRATRKRLVKMLGMRREGSKRRQVVAHRIGGIYELPETLALDWIEQGIAEDIKAEDEKC